MMFLLLSEILLFLHKISRKEDMNKNNAPLIQQYSSFFFDFDYTLADSSKGIVTCFRIVLDRHNYKGISDEAVKRTIGMTLEDSFAQLTGINDFELMTLLKDEYLKEADEIMSDNTVLYDDTLPLILQLKKQNAAVGIISTKQSYIIRQTLEKYRVELLFDTVIGLLDVKKTKPDPEGLLLGMKLVNAVREKTLYVGDNIIDAKTAEAAGVDFVGVTTGMTTEKDFEPYPHKAVLSVLSQLGDLSISNKD